ncbi:hypothetical protein KUTeg_023420 [Tegillarca granosa]|uniref:Uncharacterized protein n=1 Tax=Tegillarca granosa TaxID=220873 RepID=A0ABQ9E2K2_TEGGR|nr:hypothetical protein KUTeg_023420 [Tegillarca granosa]
MLADILTKDIKCPNTVCVDKESSSCLILDGQARVLSFEIQLIDFADVFVNLVYQSGAKFKRIDFILTDTGKSL